MTQEEMMHNHAMMEATEPMEQPMLEQKYPKIEYRPSNTQALKEYEIMIKFLDRGCIVHVGCKSIAFDNVQNAMAEIDYYVNNPYESQQKWRNLLD